MTVLTLPSGLDRARVRRMAPDLMRLVATLAAGLATAAVIAQLVTAGLWPLAVILLALPPGFVLVHRAPFSVLIIWLVVTPLVLDIPGLRPVFWLTHRLLPIGVLAVLVVGGMLGFRSRRLASLGWPEVLMAGYVLASAISVMYTSDAVGRSLIELYDRVAVPMCLYLLVRLLRPGPSMFRWLVPVAAWIVVTQTVIGALSWVAPGVLPSGWLGRAGSRTTGSLGSPSVYGITMLLAGLILLHAAANERNPRVQRLLRLLFLVTLVMMVMTLTRGVWLAAIVGVVAAAIAHPAQLRRVAVVAVPLVVLLIVTGAIGAQLDRVETRFASDETALSRLPVIYASLQMFEERPLNGWGYGNFDKYDREFQRPIGGFYPDKDQASHNVYLTLLAEQGAVGTLLFLGPAVWWTVVSISNASRLPRSGLMGRRLLWLLWGVLLGHIAVNNFSNMKVPVGLAQWWLVLALIGVMVTTADETPETTTRSGVGGQRSDRVLAGVGDR